MAHPWQATVQDQTGAIMPLAEITIRAGGPSGSIATIYSDDAGTPKANPFDADANGLMQFWAETGTYYIEGSLDGQTTAGWYISLGGGSAVLTVTAAEAIDALKAVTSGGLLCDEADVDSFAGISQAAAAIGEGVNLIRSGLVVDGSWTWTADQPVFIADSGVLTQTDTGNSRRIAWAESATSITVDVFPVGTTQGGSGEEGKIVLTGADGLIDLSLIELDDLFADSAADPASDNNGLLPALDASGLLPVPYVPTNAISTAVGGAGNEGKIVRLDGSGDLDPTMLAQVVNTAKQMVADGSIAAGAAVGLSAADTVKEIQLIEGSYSASDAGTLSSLVGDYGRFAAICYDKTNNVFVFGYQDEGNSSYFTVVAATLTGTTLFFGAPVVVESVACDACLLYFHEKTGQVVASYKNNSNDYLYYNILTVSGTTITPNASNVISSEVSGEVWSMASDPTNALIVVGFCEGAPDNAPRIVAGTVFGTSITFGAVADVNGTTDAYSIKVIFEPVSGLYLVIYLDSGADDIKARTISLSGTTITPNTAITVYNGASVPVNNIHADVNPSTGVFVIAHNKSSSVCQYVTGTISGTSVLVNSGTNFGVTAGHVLGGVTGVIYDGLTDQWILFGYQTGANDYATTYLGTMASEVLTLDDPEVTSNGYSSASSTRGEYTAFDPATQQVIFLMRTSFSFFNPLIINPASSVSNIGTFCGFAKTAAADGENLIIDIEGDINASQSGLVFDTKYYLAGDGSLSASDTGYPIVGRAWSDTKLEITTGRITL